MANQHSEFESAMRVLQDAYDHGHPDDLAKCPWAFEVMDGLIEQLETVQRQALAADRALDWIAQNHREVIIEMPTPIFADLREAGRASNPASSPVTTLPVCSECAKGHHIYCLDDGSSTVTCRCPCGDDSRPAKRPT